MFNFSKAKVLVIGDIMVDKYIFGNIEKLSFEVPIPIVDVYNAELKIGGAGIVIEKIGAKSIERKDLENSLKEHNDWIIQK